MKVVFAGTPEFAKQAYMALKKAGFDIPLVMTQPDRPAGRGLKLQASPVKQAALDDQTEILQVKSLRLDGKYPEEAELAHQRLQTLAPDVMVVAAYGLILPPSILSIPKYGCLNIHASLLPRWRGAAPIQRAIEAGDKETGICIMQMDEGLDTGDILLSGVVPITDTTNAASLHDDLAVLGAQLIVDALRGYSSLTPLPQPAEGVSYAAKIEKSEAVLDWSLSAIELSRKIRAFNPVPGVSLPLPFWPEPVKVWHAICLSPETSHTPGHVLSVSPEGIDVATGQGVLRLLELQRAGSKRQSVDIFVRGIQG